MGKKKAEPRPPQLVWWHFTGRCQPALFVKQKPRSGECVMVCYREGRGVIVMTAPEPSTWPAQVLRGGVPFTVHKAVASFRKIATKHGCTKIAKEMMKEARLEVSRQAMPTVRRDAEIPVDEAMRALL